MSAVDEEICQIDVELVLYDVMDIICKYVNGKDLTNVAKVCKSWNHAVLREKNKRYCIQQLRLPLYKTENPASVVGVIPAVSIVIYDITLEKLLSLPLTNDPEKSLNIFNILNGFERKVLEHFKKQLPNNTIVLFIHEYFTIENAKFQNTVEHHKLELTAGNGDILGLFFQRVERQVKVDVAWYEDYTSDSAPNKGVDQLVEELGLNDCEYSNSTILYLSTNAFFNDIVREVCKRAQQNGKEITFAIIVPIGGALGVGDWSSKIETFKSTNVFLRISGPTVESWSTFIYYHTQNDEIESKFLKLKEKGEADDAGAGEVSCGVRCRTDHCTDGCAIWEKALNSSCQEVCNGTQKLLSFKELYCTIGCQNAMNQHFQQLRANIGVPPTPSLVEDTLSATSLTLKWENLHLKRHDLKILYFAQWKYEDTKGNWQFCSSQTWNGNNQISIQNLQPYTRYRFRLALLLKSALLHDEPVFSEPSDSILTFPRGPPTSAPIFLKSLAIDHKRIYVSWQAGLFTNGPLFSYVLRLQQESHEAFQLKDIPISQDTFMFQHLEPNTNYSVTLTMRNGDGEGPATSTFIKTLPEPEVNSSEMPTLIISSENSIVRRRTDVPSESSLIYTSDEEIRDTAVHISKSYLFLCDAPGRLYRLSLSNATVEPILLLDANTSDLRPRILSVDWLNSALYLTGENDITGFWEIAVCNFEGKNLTSFLTKLSNHPIALEVDPFNGYLFWQAGDGIYRLDLSEIGGETEPQYEQIIKKQNLGSFLVDYSNRRLLVAYQSENTIKSVSLDGKVVVDVRMNAKQPKFLNVTSMAMTNGLFYWTDGFEIFVESYDSNENRYSHNVLFNRIDENYVRVHTLTEECQSVPMATRPPLELHALVLSDRAKITWVPPEPLGDQTAAAWSEWLYELLLEDYINGEVIQSRSIAGREHLVTDLHERSLYTIRIAAYTNAGVGPWSREFKVQTFKKNLEARILWTTNETLYQTDLIGENGKVLVNITDLDKGSELRVNDVTWYKDVLFIVGNNSKLYKYNLTDNQKSIIKFANSVSGVAIEWITKKIYWADLSKQIILRSNLNGSHEEPVAVTGIVTKLLIDSLEANLYWSTSRTVEVTRLNGEDRRVYRSEEDFDGRHVSGLTLDLENRFVYWIIGDTDDDFRLYRSFTADMLPHDREIVPEMVSTIHSIKGNSLSYISHRFFLLSSVDSALVTDAYGKYTATISNVSPTPNLQSLTLQTPLPPVLPSNTLLVVRPDAVNVSSISIAGTWRDFNITWQPVNNTNYGRIFYEVSFADYINVDARPVVTARNSVRYANADRLLPYSLIEVTIRAYSYWDTAAKVSVVLRSPQSVPSEPIAPRVFAESFKDPLAEHVDHFVTFRWNMPEFVNGPVLGFTVQCWFVIDEAEVPLFDSVNVPVSELEYKVHNLQANTTYFFKVCAYAEVGAGPHTEPISISTESENPVPQLLVATIEDVKKVDLDQNSNITITRHIAVEVAHLAAESKIYWINEMQELVTADVDGKNITKILTLNNTALSLCADWISRSLFWTESSYEDSGISHIMKLDITVWEAGVFKFSRILSRNRRIVNLDIAPLTGNLFWIELSTSNLGFVMQSDLSGDNVQPFFNHTEDCSCPFRPMIQPVFTIDNSDPQVPVMYWISAEGQLYISDIEGCSCSLVLDASYERGLPPTTLTTDKSNIYWSNMVTGKIHFTNKTTSGDDIIIKEYPISDVRSIRAIGKSLQPYPDSDCLILCPDLDCLRVYTVQQVSRTSNTITVYLPEPVAYPGCEKYSLPATLYTIDVSECSSESDNQTEVILSDSCDGEERKRYQTYWREFEAKDLKPFTVYRFRLALTNYYGEQEFNNGEQYGEGVYLKTGAGVPTSPVDVEAHSLTPTLAKIEWASPIKWNAEYVRFRVFWRATRPVDGVRPEGEKSVKDGDFTTMLHPLMPGLEYLVHVRAYPENITDVFSKSEEKLLRMLPEPENLTLSGVNSIAMNISWMVEKSVVVNYTLEFTQEDVEWWQPVSNFTTVKDRLIFQIRNLKAKKSYKFRLILRYRNFTENFIWPSDGRFTFQTLEDIPTAPGAPTLLNMQNSNYRLRWEPARSLGPQVMEYFLEGTEANSSYNVTDNWSALYNGSNCFWDIQSDMQEKYVFRVRAKNDYGFGNWSDISSVVDLTEMSRAMVIAQEHLGLILGLSVPAVTIVLLCFCYFLCPFHKKSKEVQKKIPIKTKPNVELATLREIPRGNFVETNALYVAAVETGSGDSLLPKIRRDQISLAKFLGKGAFGEVFQGVVKELEGPGSKTPIAIKTLRKGASAQEKNEFLQEAKLMSHFQHKHVLRLLGVCLDTDPPLLLLELMAGGDLLSYLRTSRSLKPTDPSALRLQDLLSMCEDVAHGCRYLEELHFVHRDLACRNCLVSARDREHRVVKIGDFGLARDIYKNDYYRKEGEGLLPVRWMAPESLVDGVFTSQSDVWAFGVLMWEITSLGQQPYQARTNLEVLHHVRAGGRLPKPLNCPPRLHQLMLRCWSAVDSRPSFKLCLEHIVALRNSTEDSTLSPVNPGQFLLHGNVYKSSHLKDNLSIQTLTQDSDSSKPALGPKYSWLLDDGLDNDESKDPRAAYEVPKSIPVAVDGIGESRYIEICSSAPGSEKDFGDREKSEPLAGDDSRDPHDGPRWNRISATSLHLPERRADESSPSSTDKRSSTSSLGERCKAAEGLRQAGSYARLVGNGESVSSLSDWRRVKRLVSGEERDQRANAEETRSNGSAPVVSYSIVSFPEGGNRAAVKLQRSKSSLQGSRANIPLVINSGLLNMLRQAPEAGAEEEEEEDAAYANIDSDTVNVTDL